MSLNKVMLIGNLGRDPEVRYMPNGDPVCNFSIATSETWNDRSTGQRQERTEWHNITLYRRLAEVAGQYLKKGSKVYIEGKVQSRKYTGKDGVERVAYDIIGNEMQRLDSRSSGSAPYEGGGSTPYESSGDGDYQQRAPKPEQSSQQKSPSAPRRQPPAAPVAPVDDIDDDIPF